MKIMKNFYTRTRDRKIKNKNIKMGLTCQNCKHYNHNVFTWCSNILVKELVTTKYNSCKHFRMFDNSIDVR
jgi:hypothetical protein